MYRRLLILCGLIAMIGIQIPAMATHIVGGDLTYKCLGNNRYQIQLIIFQDCLSGSVDAIADDIPAFIGIFNNSDVTNFSLVDEVGNFRSEVREEIVPPLFKNDCVNNAPPTCLRKVTFTKTYILPPNSTGYRVIYTRCCRNASILNINQPDRTGATYICTIPPAVEANCNNSANFDNKRPPQIICINNPFVYDYSAFDADGDSLSYEFCDTYIGGGPGTGQAKPRPVPVLPPTITQTPGYKTGFSYGNPMAGNPRIQINPKTGIITGTPNLQGRFVVTVCCSEWRNGVKINTVRREFQFVVTNCSKKVVANIPQFSDEYNTYIVECKSKTVNFVNKSTGGFSYLWDFGVPGGNSTDFEPTFTYPDTGTYNVKLIVNKGSTCPDSMERFVKVYPSFNAGFEYSGLLCPDAPIKFKDISEATYKPVTSWDWNFGDGNTSTLQDPSKSFPNGGTYNVRLISKTVKGCIDTNTQEVKIDVFRPFAGNDTVIVQGESINFNATGGTSFKWSPPDRLNTTVGARPTGYFPNVGKYNYTVDISTAQGCQGTDDINVHVVSGPRLFVPSGFTPNGDGLNDFLRPITAGYSKLNYFRVFNRWGELVYEGDNFSRGWNGKYNDKDVEVGTYFWLLSIKDRFGKDSMLKGDVSLIR